MRYRREIDGLRAFAVIPVMFFHAGIPQFSGGFIGVDVFFVISGYLITTVIVSDIENKRFSLLNFYERRARRLLPAFFLVTFVSIPFAWFWLFPSDMKDFSQSLVAASLSASNILFWRESGYFDPAAELKPLLHTWSLAVEEQYYFLFPIFLVVFWSLGKRWIVIALGSLCLTSFSFAQWASHENPVLAYYMLPTRGWELLVGAFAGFYLTSARQPNCGRALSEAAGLLGLFLIFYGVFYFNKNTPFPGFYALVPTLGALLLILFATQQTTVGRIVGSPVFVGVGLISYGAYLWHQPLFAFARHRSLNEPSEFVFYFLSALALGLAYVSWKYVEMPFRQNSTLSRSHVFRLSATLFSLLMLFGFVGHFSDGYKFRFGKEFDRFISAQEDGNPRQLECHLSTDVFPPPERYCVLGSGNVEGLLLGDSHADALSFPLSELLSKNGIAFKSITYSGCPPVENVYRVDQAAQHKCYEINKQSFTYALTSPEIKYVVLMGRWAVYLEGKYFDNKEGGVESGDAIRLDVVHDGVKQRNIEKIRMESVALEYRKSVESLLRANKKVVLIYPIPEVGFDVPKQLARLELLGKKQGLTTSYDVYVDRNRRVAKIFDSISPDVGLIRLRTDRIFCDTRSGGRCRTVDGEDILYRDDDHLSSAGARLVAKEVLRAIGFR